jgi:hypothetical protein
MFFTKRKVQFCRNSNTGICKECGELIDNIKPDDENVHCPDCDEFEVVSIDKAIACGLVEICDEGESI